MPQHLFEIEVAKNIFVKDRTVVEHSSSKPLRDYTLAEIIALAVESGIYASRRNAADIAHEFMPGTLLLNGSAHRDQLRFYRQGEKLATILDVSDLLELEANDS